MKKETKQCIHRIYDILLTLMLILSGICLIVACVGIYNSGDRPFTPEAVAKAFSGIAIPVYLCLALVVGGFILDGFLPRERKKQPVEKQYPLILKKLEDKLACSSYDTAYREAIDAQKRSRAIHRWISLGLLAAGSICFLCYGFNPANFHQQDITGSMIRAMYVLLPCIGIPFLYSVFAAYHAQHSIQKQIRLSKEALAGATVFPQDAPVPAPKKKSFDLRYAILAIAIVCFFYGLFAGGTNDVLTKAINICTECVGLG